MGLFEDITGAVAEAGAAAYEKAVIACDEVSIKVKIASIEKEIIRNYKAIGKKYAKLHREDFEEAFSEEMSKIFDCEEEIEDLEKKLEKDSEEEDNPAAAVKACVACGEQIQEEHVFCPKCGARQQKPAEEKAEEKVEEEIEL